MLGGDAGELQFVPPILGLTHPTGYPLQVLLHWLWSRLPVEDVAWSLNLFDATLAAVAIGVVSTLAHRLTQSWWGGAVAGGMLAFGELWWSQAVSGDKYTLGGLFVGLILLACWSTLESPTTASVRWLFLALGMGLTHHRAVLLLIPAIGAALALRGWRGPRGAEIARLAACVVLPLTLYLYVPWAGARGLPPGSWPVGTLVEVIEYLLDRGYTSQIRPDEAFRGRLLEEGLVLLRSFGFAGTALGLVGVAATVSRSWRFGLVLLVAFAPNAVLGASYLLQSNYAVPRHWVFFLPGFLIWAIWVGAGTVWLASMVARLAPLGWPTAARVLVGLVVTGAMAAGPWRDAAVGRVRSVYGAETLDAYRQDLQRTRVAERFGRLSLATAADGALIVCDWEQATVLWYLQRVLGQRADVTVFYPVEQLDAAVALARTEQRPLYVSRAVPGIEERGVTTSAGPLLRLWPAPSDGDLYGVQRIERDFEGGAALRGWTSWPGAEAGSIRAQSGSVLSLVLFWARQEERMRALAISVRLLDAAGHIVAQHDEGRPALGTSRVEQWPPGVPVGDFHELPVPLSLAEGSYRLVVVPYDPTTGRALRAAGSSAQADAEGQVIATVDVGRGSGALAWLLSRIVRS
ncbi:MAG: DUF2723 domain-containing protein [Chloroflexota bacterium]